MVLAVEVNENPIPSLWLEAVSDSTDSIIVLYIIEHVKFCWLVLGLQSGTYFSDSHR